MVMMPKRVKYRKLIKGQRRGIATRGADLVFGEFGLKSLANGWLKNSQIEAVRVILARQLHKGGKLWIRVFPDKAIGKILFELGGIPEEYVRICFRLVAYKLPLKAKFVTRTGGI